MKLSTATAAVVLAALIHHGAGDVCQTVEVFSVDRGTWASHGLTNAAVVSNLARIFASIPYLCPWSGVMLDTTDALKSALANPVGILLALATSDQPVWSIQDRKIVKEAMKHRRVGYLMVYDWISYIGTTDRLIPGIPAAFVSPGHSQIMRAVDPSAPYNNGPAGVITDVLSPACWTSTGAISSRLSRRRGSGDQTSPGHSAEPFYGNGAQVDADVQFTIKKYRTTVYYSTTFLWVFLTGLSGQPDWCVGDEPANTLIRLFTNYLAYVSSRLTFELPSIDDTAPGCPEIIATKSWIPSNKKFFPLSLVQDPDDVADPTLAIAVTSCSASEPGKAKLGKDCHVDEVEGNTLFIRATKDGNAGRMYAISYLATNDAGLSCAGVVFACVPSEAATVYSSVNQLNKPHGKSNSRTCPSIDELTEWHEHLNGVTDADRQALLSVTSSEMSTSEQGNWQFGTAVALIAATLFMSISSLATMCYQLRAGWDMLKEEAFGAALSRSPCQMQHVDPTL